VVPFLIAVLLCGTLNSNIFVGSRYTQAAACEGHLPLCLSCTSLQSASPRPALVVQALLTLAISFINVDTLINYVVFVIWAQKAITMAALLYIRYGNIPVSPDVIRVPIVLTLAFFCISTALVLIPFWQDWSITLTGVAIVASGFIFYCIFVRPENLPVQLRSLNEYTTRATERLFKCKAVVREKAPEAVVFANEEVHVGLSE